MRHSHILPLLFGLLIPLSCTWLVEFDPEDVTPEDCFNGFDDDGDGYADCRDQDCWDLPECLNLYEDCYNWLDDNGNGLIDCEDPECARSENCMAQSDLCNDTTGNGEITMYASVYPDSAGVCPPMMECRIERLSSDGVPRCMLAGGFRAPLEPCDNDLECPMGHVCQWSDTISPFTENQRPVCLPMCANPLGIGCPGDLRCLSSWSVWDQTLPGAQQDVLVMSCDKPLCDVLNGGLQTCDESGACYPEPDMMGQGYCAPSGLSGHLVPCDRDSECLPRHRCHQNFDGGDRGQCRLVCLTSEDCRELSPDLLDFECVKMPDWATYGVCEKVAVGW
jgi:hypothetical protein